MASSPLVAATVQSACLGVASSILAQALTAYNEASGSGKPVSLTVDWVPVMQYLLYILISTPPNFKWQQLLESSFPAYPAPSSQQQQHAPPEKQHEANGSAKHAPKPATQPPLSRANTLIKLLLDQTLAAALNTLLYSVFTRSLRAAMHPQPALASPLDALRYLGGHRFSGAGAPLNPHAPAGRAPVDFSRVRWADVWAAARGEFWPMLLAGGRLWPLVALLNFSLVRSVQGRNLVSGVAGLGWGVYVCLAAQ